MRQNAVEELLSKWGALELLNGIETLSDAQQNAFLLQLNNLDFSLLLEQRNLLLQSKSADLSKYTSCHHFEKSGSEDSFTAGASLIRQGKVGCLILAGGQGTRLGADVPKGTIPVTVSSKKSLFELFCERTKAASLFANQQLPLCVMTSETNHEKTVGFLQTNEYFGLHPSQLSFFQQGKLPLIDDRGNWVLERPGVVAQAPDGNGHALYHFFQSGLWKQYRDAGVEYLNVIFVDNALADPFDLEFIGFTAQREVDASLKAIERLSLDEKMGVLVEKEGKLKVIEYSELPADSSAFTLCSTGMFCLSMEFIRRLCQELRDFPLHLAHKKAMVWLETPKGYAQEEVYLWKCERFIFDLLDHVHTSAVLVCPREEIYAPLKNATGDRSLETVQRALLLYDQTISRFDLERGSKLPKNDG